MAASTSAQNYLPERLNLTAPREAAESCEGCELFQKASQTVFGEGLRKAWLMLVGEMPGDQKDKHGKPFVGPAGRLLDESLAAAGIEKTADYVTNVVKHFRWQPRGKRRLHKRPGQRHVEACRPWLQAEILTVKPRLIVCLGATAAQALLGRDFRITRQRGELFDSHAGTDGTAVLMATYHPAAILRAPEKSRRDEMRNQFVDDLRRAAARAGP